MRSPRFDTLLIHGVLTVLVLLVWLIPGASVKGEDQDRQVLSPAPARLISLAPSITEIIYFLEAGDRLVGVTAFCNYPPEAKAKPRIGTYWAFSLEAILALKPDLVLAMAHQGDDRNHLDLLKLWRIPVYLGKADSLPELFRLMEDIARLLGKEEVASRKLPALRERARRVELLVAPLRRLRVFLEIDQEPLITVGPDSIQSDLIQRAGGENIARQARQRYPLINLEEVLRAQPEVILFTGMAKEFSLPGRLRFWRQWPFLPAVKTDRLFWLEPDLVDRPGPRLVEGLELIASYLHPEAFSGRRAP